VKHFRDDVSSFHGFNSGEDKQLVLSRTMGCRRPQPYLTLALICSWRSDESYVPYRRTIATSAVIATTASTAACWNEET
jgi:hypothetical protein